MRPFCRKNHVHKILVLGGGGILGFGGGGSADFIFMGARIFLREVSELCHLISFAFGKGPLYGTARAGHENLSSSWGASEQGMTSIFVAISAPPSADHDHKVYKLVGGQKNDRHKQFWGVFLGARGSTSLCMETFFLGNKDQQSC